MLVLSRRPGQRILFPEYEISVQVLPQSGSAVRLGIEAPAQVTVVREEISPPRPPSRAAARKKDALRHELRGRLNGVAMALHVLEKQVKAGRTEDAQATLLAAQDLVQRPLHAENDAVSAERPEAQAGSRRPLRALLVEDDVNQEALLLSYLQLSGFEVEAVHDGYEALEFLRGNERPDFLLLDMRLPRCDGPTIVRAIRQDRAFDAMTIFAVTGSSPSDFAGSIGRAGVDAWFQKPLNPRRLVEAMSAAPTRN